MMDKSSPTQEAQMAVFRPVMKNDTKPVEVKLSLTAEQHDHLKKIGDPKGLTVSEVLEQFVSWAMTSKVLTPEPKKRMKKSKTE